MEPETKTIMVIGALAADRIMVAPRVPDAGESMVATQYEEALGGKGAITALSAYRSCHNKASSYKGDGAIRVNMIGKVGDDLSGKMIKEELDKSGIDVTGIEEVPNTRTSICSATIEESSRENQCLAIPDATAAWKKGDFLKASQFGCTNWRDLIVAQMEIDKDVVENMIRTAGHASIPFCLNAAPASPINENLYRSITHLLVNESEAAIMCKVKRNKVKEKTWPKIAEQLRMGGVKNVVITLGAKGAFYANAKGSGHCPGYVVTVKDTMGAGDVFAGAYASEYLRQDVGPNQDWDIESAVIRGNKAAAIAIQSSGAQEGIPWEDEIDKFAAPLKEHEPPSQCRVI
ncbi:ribokinase [Colletotrichum phormii]|uniref:Ribokinase n=1 Tax=Colletotrichum phormii TaxID=359342 RepID=A0AAI9ZBJ0_9PEZI|nr:ribokinase [Colletotrichum phormii]KAK1621488.1 ribokinase [Colletotrichum phormii]